MVDIAPVQVAVAIPSRQVLYSFHISSPYSWKASAMLYCFILMISTYRSMKNCLSFTASFPGYWLMTWWNCPINSPTFFGVSGIGFIAGDIVQSMNSLESLLFAVSTASTYAVPCFVGMIGMTGNRFFIRYS